MMACILNVIVLVTCLSTSTIAMTIVQTTTPTTTPYDGCRDENKPTHDPCAYCECDTWSGRRQWSCYWTTCMSPPCVDSYVPVGGCCPVCPNGPNCQYGGFLLRLDETKKIGDQECRCVQEYRWFPPKAVCRVITTVPPTTTTTITSLATTTKPITTTRPTTTRTTTRTTTKPTTTKLTTKAPTKV